MDAGQALGALCSRLPEEEAETILESILKVPGDKGCLQGHVAAVSRALETALDRMVVLGLTGSVGPVVMAAMTSEQVWCGGSGGWVRTQSAWCDLCLQIALLTVGVTCASRCFIHLPRLRAELSPHLLAVSQMSPVVHPTLSDAPPLPSSPTLPSASHTTCLTCALPHALRVTTLLRTPQRSQWTDTPQPSWEPSWRPEESGTQVCLVAWLWWCTHFLQVVRHQRTDLGQAVPTTTSLPDIGLVSAVNQVFCTPLMRPIQG